MSTVKFIGAWGCLIAAIVVMVLPVAGANGLAVPLSIMSIAFSQAPTSGG